MVTADQILSGSVAGMCNQIVCHPFDTLRTRLQMQGEKKVGPLSCFRGILRNEGALGLYKGLTPPLFAQAIYKSVCFTVNEKARELLARKKREWQQSTGGSSNLFSKGHHGRGIGKKEIPSTELARAGHPSFRCHYPCRSA